MCERTVQKLVWSHHRLVPKSPSAISIGIVWWRSGHGSNSATDSFPLDIITHLCLTCHNRHWSRAMGEKWHILISCGRNYSSMLNPLVVLLTRLNKWYLGMADYGLTKNDLNMDQMSLTFCNIRPVPMGTEEQSRLAIKRIAPRNPYGQFCYMYLSWPHWSLPRTMTSPSLSCLWLQWCWVLVRLQLDSNMGCNVSQYVCQCWTDNWPIICVRSYCWELCICIYTTNLQW